MYKTCGLRQSYVCRTKRNYYKLYLHNFYFETENAWYIFIIIDYVHYWVFYWHEKTSIFNNDKKQISHIFNNWIVHTGNQSCTSESVSPLVLDALVLTPLEVFELYDLQLCSFLSRLVSQLGGRYQYSWNISKPEQLAVI